VVFGRGGALSESRRRRARRSPFSPLSAAAEPVVVYRGNIRDPILDNTEGRLGMGDAVMWVIGASRILRSSMLIKGLSSCSNSTSSCVDELCSIPNLPPVEVVDCADTWRRKVANG